MDVRFRTPFVSIADGGIPHSRASAGKSFQRGGDGETEATERLRPAGWPTKSAHGWAKRSVGMNRVKRDATHSHGSLHPSAALRAAPPDGSAFLFRSRIRIAAASNKTVHSVPLLTRGRSLPAQKKIEKSAAAR